MVRQFKRQMGTLYVRDVPMDDRAAFHVACTKRGWSMKRVILKFIKDFAEVSNDRVLDWNQTFYPLRRKQRPIKKVKKKKEKP